MAYLSSLLATPNAPALMALPISISTTCHPQRFHNPVMAITIFLALFLLPLSNAISAFNFSSFSSNADTIFFQGDAFSADGMLQLTKNTKDNNRNSSVGRATYKHPVRLHDAKTGRLTDFTSHFSYVMKAQNWGGDGLSFFLAPNDSQIPANSSGEFLALFNPKTARNETKENQIVAVEFDTFQNDYDPSSYHVGIDVNSIVSVRNVSLNYSKIEKGEVANAWVSYNSTTKNLTVFITYDQNPVFNGNCTLWYEVDFSDLLPEWVRVGFSAATGAGVETHAIVSWEFASTLEVEGSSRLRGLAIGLPVGLSASLLVLCICAYRIRNAVVKEEEQPFDASIDVEFENGTGPKRFTYQELAHATNQFDLAGKLGEGGFGGVYKGTLSQSNTEVAVKRVSRGSKQGKKEYVSEVKIISRLRHRNLVQLIGWCHEQGELLLVYEYLPNGSLDSHLFGVKPTLTWNVRYKIALGLASSILYLHEEWEQCVVHRDIKSSNIMLDSNFNAKLGDFGLARLVDHELGSQTTVLAGTMGYLAPECVTTGKASKESDVYSFGVVALEITCGRKPVEPKQELGKVRLIEWVWDLYGKGQLLEAVDKRLTTEPDQRQIESLMIVGLWCCHPDSESRPSIRQVINVLKFEAPLPSLPARLPVPMYYAPPMNMLESTDTSSGFTGTGNSLTSSSSGTCSTNSSGLSRCGSTKALLKTADA